ncbi:MAG: putative essential recombination function protein [Prokaryotic dsDNA virus sp.]|jgi:hypothetical protein|nr:MAG: putative essential recombination function protein [Prokaryotic dsDNA virus sp.]|tara:strand:+ start:1833 stop:2453 length:621 start_codon:yes stop_codon:yes gene_type:complete
MTEHSSITAALAAFHLDVSTIEKTARAQYGQFADLSTVLSAVTPALSKNGLALVQTLDTEGGDDVLCTTLYHTSGQHIFSRARLVRVEGAGGRQNPLHLWGSSVTYQRRFCALALLGLAAGMEDDDGDSAGPAKQVKKPASKPKPRELASFEGVEEALKILDKSTKPSELALWVARLKASSLSDDQVAELRDSYAEHQARLQEQGA